MRHNTFYPVAYTLSNVKKLNHKVIKPNFTSRILDFSKCLTFIENKSPLASLILSLKILSPVPEGRVKVDYWLENNRIVCNLSNFPLHFHRILPLPPGIFKRSIAKSNLKCGGSTRKEWYPQNGRGYILFIQSFLFIQSYNL